MKSGPWVGFWCVRAVLPSDTAALSMVSGAACYRRRTRQVDDDLHQPSCYTPYNAYLSLYGSYTNLADGTHTPARPGGGCGWRKGP
ncbi:MAG: hypothetical protein R2714_16465 [Microthrixaceae bacterium]